MSELPVNSKSYQTLLVDLAQGSYCATGCCTNSVVPPLRLEE